MTDKVREAAFNLQVKRTIGRTNMNEYSSRSHTIYRMIIESREKSSADSRGGALRQAALSFVDLAGSERIRQTGSEGIRLKEGGHINRSLLSLATVINKLAEGSQHIPYRDSKLTRILQPSLGGNACTAIICAITPSALYVDESLSTLKFASRARSIENKPVINEIVSDEVRLKRYERETEGLRERLRKRRLNEGSIDPHALQASLQLLRAEVADFRYIIEHVEADVACHGEFVAGSVERMLRSMSQQIDFLGLERRALEVSSKEQHALSSAKLEALAKVNGDLTAELKAKEDLVSELRTNSQYLVEQLQKTEEHLMDEMARLISERHDGIEQAVEVNRIECNQCSKFRSEIAQLNDSLCRLEEQHSVWTAVGGFGGLLLERDAKIQDLQADVEDLLARISAQQSEWRSR